MKRFNLIYILLVTFSLISFSFTIDNSKNKQEDPKKTKQEDPKKTKEDPKKSKLEDSKKSKEELQKSKAEEALKSKTEDLKKSKSDTIKKIKVVTEELAGDSIVIYKGKFKPYKKKAHASYYHDKFNGKRTASGKKYDKNKFTAAHKKLAFGTKVRVTNESNGKSVVVEITDRGPFTKGREIDLSRKAFMAIAGGSGSGSVNATLEVLQE